MNRGSIPERGQKSSIRNIQISSEANPDSYSRDFSLSLSLSLSLDVNQPEREGDHSSPSSVQVKNTCSYTSTPPHTLHESHRGKFKYLQILLSNKLGLLRIVAVY